MRLTLLAAVVLLVSCSAAVAPPVEAPKLEPGQKWYHRMTNLLNDDALDGVIEQMKRAKKAGYNGIQINDVKFIKFHVQPPHFVENVKKFRQATRDIGLKCIVGCMDMGYAENILAHDPNLAEGMPVRDAVFVVKGGKLVPDASEYPTIINPSFEEFSGNTPAGWQIDAPGVVSFIDRAEKSAGKASVRQTDAGINDKTGRVRLYQKFAVKPWRYYHVTVMVKSDNLRGGDLRVMALGGDGNRLNYQPSPIERTMGWTKIHATFDSRDNTEVALYLGSWNPKSGTIWWDNVAIEPGGFVNVIRRDSLPLTVKSEDGATVYAEGKDFAEVRDPLLVNDPREGYFTLWHDAPEVAIPAGSRLQEGQKVLVSYNFATTSGKDFQIMCCMSEPALYDVLEKDAVWIRDNLQPDAYMMAHDEIRHHGWDDTCVATGKTNGQILADNVKRCTEIIERVDPGKPILVWSDMFDAHHNAGAKNMYLDKGEYPWKGSWEGLPKQVGIINWSDGKPESFKFFADRGHQQIISGVESSKIRGWLDAVGKNPGVVGVMYTTWEGDMSDNFEKYVEAVDKWEKETGGFGK